LCQEISLEGFNLGKAKIQTKSLLVNLITKTKSLLKAGLAKTNITSEIISKLVISLKENKKILVHLNLRGALKKESI
jgi:hypothetical protein